VILLIEVLRFSDPRIPFEAPKVFNGPFFDCEKPWKTSFEAIDLRLEVKALEVANIFIIYQT